MKKDTSKVAKQALEEHILVVGDNMGYSSMFLPLLDHNNISYNKIDPLPRYVLKNIAENKEHISHVFLTSCNIPRDDSTTDIVNEITNTAESIKPQSIITLESHGIALAKAIRDQDPTLPIVVNYIGHGLDLVKTLLNTHEDTNIALFGVDCSIREVLSFALLNDSLGNS